MKERLITYNHIMIKRNSFLEIGDRWYGRHACVQAPRGFNLERSQRLALCSDEILFLDLSNERQILLLYVSSKKSNQLLLGFEMRPGFKHGYVSKVLRG